ncbi:nucleotide exchange factor GrpE [Thiospirochaeta perfilievii]|uniref:Protein GrpE n=1 Tax=Thiospirochaeta perfilievii TaxID=252967 RepID=A0A5C1QAD0_9SPIO|nr:nucleotide exchange factor GrpE [Thiospirochaeta perfilievii]QEN03614.1 nucleotide exchange factor GrpE [Thiospirochaeta perfilievii]
MNEDKDKEEILEEESKTPQVEDQEVETGETEEETSDETPMDELAFKDARIKELEESVEEHKANYLRKHADFENFRRRMLKEKSDSIKHANESLITDLIEVVDNFDRALLSANDNEDFNSFKEGIEMIEKQFKGMLSSNWGLSRIESVGKEFDPQIHEAMFMEDSADVEVPTVCEEFQSGYKLHDKVLRAPKVKVQKPIDQ